MAPEQADPSLSLTSLLGVDEICDRFEHAIQDAREKAGNWPCVEDYLGAAAESIRNELRKELLAVERSYREPHVENSRNGQADSTSLISPVASAQLQGARTEVPSSSTADGGPANLPAGSRIGRYKIERALGTGSFGSVYLASDEQLHGPVAIKIVRPDRLAPGADDVFFAEARTVARLKHAGIVRVYDVGRHDDGRPYAVMEYIEGRPLTALLAKERPAYTQTAELLASVADAIDHAHQQGFVHRDLKPDNIVLDASGVPRVLDFGLALHESVQRDRAGEMAGTLNYMAPEQVRRESQRLDGRADIWALGVIFYEMLTGRKPFGGAMKADLCDEILHREPKPPRQINPEVPEALERICLKCLQKDVSLRYLTAGDVARDLRRWSRPSIRKVWAVPAVAMSALLVGGTWFATRHPATATNTAPPNTALPNTAPPNAALPSAALPNAGSLQGKVDILLWDKHDKSRNHLSIREPGARPLHAGDQIRVRVELNRPAYVYLLWIDGQGKVLPVYPWKPGDWATRTSPDRPVVRLDLPPELDRGWPMGGDAGMETFVLLARESPLPAGVDLEQVVSGLPPQNVLDENALAEFDGGTLVTDTRERSRAPQFSNSQQIDDPILQAQKRLAERLGKHFEMIRAVSFANRGE
jgi:serine/threonine protein kinase